MIIFSDRSSIYRPVMKFALRKRLLIPLLLATVLLFSNSLEAQDTGCKVLLPSISGSYQGKCKKGLAQGKGVAVGTDRYEGYFYRGLPQGNGTYTWADGSYYTGQWNKGLREGKGTMVYPEEGADSVVTGFWKNDRYIGAKFIAPYKINRSIGVVRYSTEPA